MSTTVIKLEKLTFFGYHGINQDEIQNGQDFVLDLTLHYQLSNKSDDIEPNIELNPRRALRKLSTFIGNKLISTFILSRGN